MDYIWGNGSRKSVQDTKGRVAVGARLHLKPMDATVENLARLQQLDSEIQQLTQALAALPRRLSECEAKLKGYQANVAGLEKKLQEEEALRRRFESDLADQRQKIVKFRNQTSSVKNNEQFHALQHEIGFAEAEVRRLEDAELEGMMRTEELQAQLAAAQAQVASYEKDLAAERESTRRSTEFQEAALKKWRGERASVRPTIPEEILAQYDRVAGSRGTGLARASNQRCTGCQMGLRPQAWNQVRTGALMNCESCGRLLYFNPRLEPQIETGAPENAGRRPA